MSTLQLIESPARSYITLGNEISGGLCLLDLADLESKAGFDELHDHDKEVVRMAGFEKRLHAQHHEGRISSRHLRPQQDSSPGSSTKAMPPSLRLSEQFKGLFSLAVQMTDTAGVDAIVLLLDGPADWARLKSMAGKAKLIVAADADEHLAGANDAGLASVRLDMPESTIYERLTQSVLEAVADDLLAPGSCVLTLYSGFDADSIDSLSLINLDEHLNRLTGRDLRQLETRVPLDTLKIVVDLAVEIGREGREGKPVGTLFVVGDARKVLSCSRPVGFDPVRGYNRKERNLDDPRVREGIKEIAQMDGAIIVSSDGVVEAACRYLDSSAADVTLSKGLGARHWAAAAISRATNAVAVTVSQSNGTVRIFHNGEVVLRIEPYLRRPMVWKSFEYEPPEPESKSKTRADDGE
ncbi:MAG: DNA integrity scanning protein DisA nucleotide-binding domain protein [Thermoguttaceae bacterium]